MKVQNKTLYILIIIFAIFGIIIAGTLTLAKYYDKVAVLCGEDKLNSCNTVQNSPYSYLVNEKTNDGSTLKIPLTLLGVLFYLLLTVMTILLYKNESKNKKEQFSSNKTQKIKYWLFGFGVFGVIFSAWFTYIQANIIKAFCTYCLISGFDTVVLLVLITWVVFFNKK